MLGHHAELGQFGHPKMLAERPLAREVLCHSHIQQHGCVGPQQILCRLQGRHPRRGEREPLVTGQVGVIGDDTDHVGPGRRGLGGEPQVAPDCLRPNVNGVILAKWLETAWALWIAHPPFQLELLAVVDLGAEGAVLLERPDRTGGRDHHQRSIGAGRWKLVPGRLEVRGNRVLPVAAHHRGTGRVQPERQLHAGAVDAGGADAAGGSRRVTDLCDR
ncbi:Uncharacterised protein [Mycobacteroides abscessus subsp. bolletii]|nr:Uncharacterised protein [Mycobacteroides abscessus subsp. bolletii]SHS92446.1 Uncharacterised protein [Mycobacteroides abscessus subsp. bolletii]SHT48321.1 Uncharacterised protein [Mycobacteroides abscessus subsp. bolletii]SHT59739.1 Uncharacterised protein [Mycobacteroides abscessus subsp. bolletii]SKE61112.1 Uncharacterised protein [Mycobacteroides abscessus subsp. bolletii]